MIKHYVFRLQSRIQRRLPSQRPFSSQQYLQNGPISVARPILWSASAITGIYLTAAAWELESQIKDYEYCKIRDWVPGLMTFEGLQSLRLQRMQTEQVDRRDTGIGLAMGITDVLDGSIRHKYQGLTGPEKAAWMAIGANTTIHLTTSWNNFGSMFWHVPLSGRNWTLLTSTFGHSGMLHLLLNMYVLNNFVWGASGNQTFQSSTPHCVAFYLSSGILATLAYHLQAVAKPAYRYIPCLGASGAIMAMLGVYGTTYPSAGIGIIFLPFFIPASEALVALTLFEAYGTIFGTRLGLAHAAHLGGLLTGMGYVWNGTGEKIWTKTKLILFNRLYGGARYLS